MKVLVGVLRWFAGLMVVAAAGWLFFQARPLTVLDVVTRFGLWRQGVRSEWVGVDGYRVHYYKAPAARPDAKVLVLVHGLGDRADAWAGLIPPLAAAGFHVYALDLLGYGRTSKPEDVDYSIGVEEKLVVDWMRGLGLAHADVAGWSMGGWVVLKLGLEHPELAERLVVYDSAGVYWSPTWEPSLFHPTDRAQLEQLMGMLSPKPAKFPDFVVTDVLRKFDQQWWVVDRGLASMRSGRELLDFRLGGIKQPTLVVWGAKDVLIPVSAGERMHADMPGSQMVLVDGCGHLAPSECKEPVLKATIDFLNQR